MTIPPDEVVENPDNPTKSAVSSGMESVSKSKNNKILFDIWIGLVIFIASGIELISWLFPQDKEYLLFWYPLLNNITLLAFSSFFVVKSFRYVSCVYSKIASIGYALVNLITFFAILLPVASITTMLAFASPVIVCCIIVSLLIVFVRYVANNRIIS